MAERVAEKMAGDQGLDLDVVSYGISDEEHDAPIDPRAVITLEEAGYRTDGHHARKVAADDLVDADLIVAVEPFHIARLRGLAPEAHIALLNDFNPAKPKGESLEDPWYGGQDGFTSTLADIEAAMPGILETVTARWDVDDHDASPAPETPDSEEASTLG